jgi:phosphopantothenoylcysteine decarboxylase/phosphopantothenate--cysteine ligase
VVAAPAMNVRMWEHPATQANAGGASSARRRAHRARGGGARRGRARPRPDGRAGGTLCALPGAPRPHRTAAGKRVVVSRGGTREPIDLVSSSATARRGGWESPSQPRPSAAAPRSRSSTRTASRPLRRGRGRARSDRADSAARSSRARNADVVSWPRPSRTTHPAIRRRQASERQGPWTITLEPTEDVLAELGRRKHNGQILSVRRGGRRGRARTARGKLANKNGNLFVYNDVSQPGVGFESERTRSSSSRRWANGDRQAKQGGMCSGYPR